MASSLLGGAARCPCELSSNCRRRRTDRHSPRLKPVAGSVGEFGSESFFSNSGRRRRGRRESHGQRSRIKKKLAPAVKITFGGEKDREQKKCPEREEEQDGDGFQHSAYSYQPICKFVFPFFFFFF